VLRTRVKTACIVLPALLAIIIFAPPLLFDALIVVLAFWGLYEVGQMLHADGIGWVVLAVAGGVPAIEPLLRTAAPPAGWFLCIIVFVFMMMLIAQVSTGGIDRVPHGALLALLGALWVGVLFPYFALLRNQSDGVSVIILMLMLVVASDSGAYFVGRSAGRIKLIPRVSPNKTVEGAAGGMVGSLIVGIALRSVLAPRLSLAAVAILAFGVAVLAQVGDLANSAFKRVAGVKDSGRIFPGHGGLLDRSCSLVFPAVLTYYYLR
jgi:phosphatidate cytidylyltransferase